MLSVKALRPKETVVVLSQEQEEVKSLLHGVHIAYQTEPLGTGDAVKAAVQKLDHFDGTVLVTYGADPLIGIETLEKMVVARDIENPPDVVVFVF